MGASGNRCYDLYFVQCTQVADTEISLIKKIYMVVKLCWQQYLSPLSGEVSYIKFLYDFNKLYDKCT